MKEDLLAWIPAKSTELRPLSSVGARFWTLTSLTLIAGGLTLMGWGGWLFYRYQREVNAPPARILEVISADLSDSSEMELVPAVLDVTDGSNSAAVLPALSGTSFDAVSLAVNASVLTNTETKQSAQLDEVDITAGASVSTISDTIRTINLGKEISSESGLSVKQLPSLADNPLPVIKADTAIQGGVANQNREEGATPIAFSPPTRIKVQDIDLDADVVAVGWKQIFQDGVTTNVWEVADYAAGWHKNSQLPGQGGNIVLSGHNNINGEVFRYLGDLEVGSLVTLYVDDQPYEYAVADKFIVKDKGQPDAVRRENARWIGDFADERLTLVTCWPYTNNTHRLIIIARPVGIGLQTE